MNKTVLCLVLFCTTTLFSQTFTVDNVIYTATSVTEVSVTGNTITTPSAITIPSTVSDGVSTFNVISIGTAAFSNCAGLTSITIPSGVTSIGVSAFQNCTGLSSITIPNSVTSISSSTFKGCTSLTSITLPTSLLTIGSNTFLTCTSLTSISLPSSVTTIGNFVFSGCTSLTSISLPTSLTSIEAGTFNGCTSLTSISLPTGLITIAPSAFSGCTGLTSITLPSSVTNIGSFAFYGCTSLTSITLPSQLQIGSMILSNTFQNCSSLTSITLPISVTYISNSSFEGCTSLSSVTTLSNIRIDIRSNAFKNCTSLASFTTYGESIELGVNQTAFSGVTLSSVNLYVPTASIALYRDATVWRGFNFPPIITGPGSSTVSTSTLSMNENSTTVTTFTADETVTWSLGSSNDSALFSINSSGVLVFNAAPDYESTLHNNTYIVEVKATDTNSVTTSQQLTITITDVAENLSPAVLSNFNSFTVSVGDSEFIINAPTSNSSGAITYTSSNPAVATFSGTSVYLVGPGTTTITATQAASGSYLGNSISATMTVSALCGNWGYSLTYPVSSPVTVGDSYGGGIAAYILQPGDPHYSSRVQHGLIASSANLSTASPWTSGEIPFSGAAAIALGTGNQNTIDIVAGDATAGLAARLCYDLVEGGYSDWYLPSRDELSKLYLNRIAIGGFSQNWYWSSTKQPENEPQFPGKYAWYVSFYNNEAGVINGHFTTTTNAVRAVRSF